MANIQDSVSIGRPRIKVVGVGGGGTNAINRMIDEDLEGVEFIALSTDSATLRLAKADVRILLGKKLTRGLGSGGNFDVGEKAFEESRHEVRRALEGAELVFVTAGLGGGTGSGAAPLVAEMAREMGALTIAVVTKPFLFEGKKRMKVAELGLACLRRATDSVIVVPNERLLAILPKGTRFKDALRKSDEVLLGAVQSIADLIHASGDLQVDFSDVRTVMSHRGAALIGTGIGRGENRAMNAAADAISSPLLDNISITGAAAVLINVTGGMDLALDDVVTITSIIQAAAGDEAEIIVGALHDPTLADSVRVTVIATGFDLDLRIEPNEVLSLAAPERPGPVPEPASELSAEYPPESLPEPAFVIAWDPEFVDPEVYAEVVQILGDLTRLQGGKGIARIGSKGFGVPALDEVFA